MFILVCWFHFVETNFFTVSEQNTSIKLTFQRLRSLTHTHSSRAFCESRISENSNMYSKTNVLYVSRWRYRFAEYEQTNRTNVWETSSFWLNIPFECVQHNLLHKSLKSRNKMLYRLRWFGNYGEFASSLSQVKPYIVIYIYRHVYIYMYTSVYIYIYIYAYMHMYMYVLVCPIHCVVPSHQYL